MFRSTALGCLAGLLMAVDGLQFVMSRIGLLSCAVAPGARATTKDKTDSATAHNQL